MIVERSLVRRNTTKTGKHRGRDREISQPDEFRTYGKNRNLYTRRSNYIVHVIPLNSFIYRHTYLLCRRRKLSTQIPSNVKRKSNSDVSQISFFQSYFTKG